MADHRGVRRVRLAVALGLACSLSAGACSSTSKNDSSKPTTSTAAKPTSTTAAPGRTGQTSPVRDGIRIEVLSSQPDRVSGDDARIRVTPAARQSTGDLKVTLADKDVTGELSPADGALEGIVTGFSEGNNTLKATAGSKSASQLVRAWPLAGPVFSGPHLPLKVCSTEENGLGPPTDADCSAPTRVTWRYIDTAGAIKDLPKPEDRPADIGTARIDGRDVPLFVRYEQGVINRAVYEVATVDATPGDPKPKTAEPGWNHRLLYRYGGGCGTTYGQGSSATKALEPVFLKQGYAVATASFNTFGVQCNDVLSAETTMMVKERVIEEFGVPDFTIGEGGSGGAIQLHLQVQNYPGLVDGVVAELPFPDAITIASGVTDCGLLLRYEESPTGKGLTPAQRQAIAGHATPATCETWRRTFLSGIDPTTGCDAKIPASEIYDPTTNKGGLRCTLQDANRNQFGIDDKTGFAKRPLDNVGVQYGLEALKSGVITPQAFLDLNEKIGGYDIDGQFQPEREAADPQDVLHAYETGRVASRGGDLLTAPIIDINLYTDPSGDIHDRFRAFSLRDRLAPGDTNEGAPGFQIWTRDPGQVDLGSALGNSLGGSTTFGADAVKVMDQWLTALDTDKEGGDRRLQLRRTRPAAAVDNCTVTGTDRPIVGVGIYEKKGPCRDRFPIAGDPRTAAGAPRRNDILKCDLKPVDPSDYDVTFSAAQLDRLDRIFAGGVCDYRRPGVGQTSPAQPDRSYDDVITPEGKA